MSFFDSVTQLPEDPIFHIPVMFAADPRPSKVNLGIGCYQTAEGSPLIFSSVKKAEDLILKSETSKNYLPIEGDPQFIKNSTELVFGLRLSIDGIYTVQALGGTGALRVGGEFLSQEISKTIFIPSPTWPNHKLVFTRSGMKVHTYRYYLEASHRFDFAGMCNDIMNMPPGSTILLHANCHNPTGIDPSFAQWQELSSIIKKQKIIPLFDFAYQGLINTPEEDAQVIRYFASEGHDMLVANSYSKNFGLYSERIGTLFVITKHKDAIRKISSQIKQICRGNFSNPPRHGSQIVKTILQSENLKQEWMQELSLIREHIKAVRHAFIAGLQAKYSGRDWSFLGRQNGLFSFCGIHEDQVHRLIKDYAIYMPSNGRINISAVNIHNINYIIDAIVDVLQP